MLKMQILKSLKEGEGYLSGQELADTLQVSRTAVWKMIKQLQQAGYQINAVPNKGYCLASDTDILSREELLSVLDESWLAQDVIFYDSVNSTNTLAKQLAEQGAADNTLIVANDQTAGRGRRGREWVSPSGEGVWMSLILRPPLHPLSASMMTLAAALAVCKGIETVTKLVVEVKWPNDIVMNGRKVCGILSEMSSEPDAVHYLIVGIGINVNVTSFPSELSEVATSCFLESQHTVIRRDLITAVMQEMKICYQLFLEKQNLSQLLEQYQDRLVNRGRAVKVISGKSTYQGVALGINEAGELLVRLANGTVKTVAAGEVSVRGVYGYV